jgi:hypothetical protein
VTEYMLKLAWPDNPDDCLAEPLLSLLQSPPWVVYLTFGDLYLSDVNDDPDLENEYEVGLGLWTVCVRTLFEALCRWSGGIPVRVSLSRQAGLAELVGKLIGRAAVVEWMVQPSPRIDPELVESMATFGWEAAIWTALPDGEAAALSRGSILMPDLEQLIPRGDVPWWLSHGYKEPFLTGHTPSLSMAAVADLIRKEVRIPVQVTEEPFVPHRVRMHRRWTA